MTPGPRRSKEERTELASELAETEQLVGRSGSKPRSRHRRRAEVVRLARAVMREQAQEQVGLAASGAAFWLIISAFPTAIAAVSVFGLVVSPGDVARYVSHTACAPSVTSMRAGGHSSERSPR